MPDPSPNTAKAGTPVSAFALPPDSHPASPPGPTASPPGPSRETPPRNASTTHRLPLSRYLVLVAVMLGASVGDALLSRGMREVGPVSLAHLGLLLHALLNPWVLAGIAVLIGFMATYMTALSFADLTFVQPATAFGNVVTALVGRLWLHESISPLRWLGIALIVVGVGFVANGPSRTEHPIAAETA